MIRLEKLLEDKYIVLYDGICGFCNTSIQFILKNKPDPNICLVSYQSKIGKELVKIYAIDGINSIVFIEKGVYFDRSSAIFRIATKLNSKWRYLAFASIIPKFLTDLIYNFIAKNRYKFMGKMNSCIVPTNEEKKLFYNLSDKLCVIH